MGLSRTLHGVRELKPHQAPGGQLEPAGRTLHGVRELKRVGALLLCSVWCRTLHGVRELKLVGGEVSVAEDGSHPSRGA